MKEKRLEDRCMCADLVRVDWMTGEDDFRTAEGVLEDIAPHGASIEVEEAIPAGASITISSPARTNTSFSGFVLYCHETEYGYIVGIRLSNDHRWTCREFRPNHLTDFRELIARSGSRDREPPESRASSHEESR